MTTEKTDLVDDSTFIDLEDISLSYSFGEARPRRDALSFKASTWSAGQHLENLSSKQPSDQADIEALIMAFENLQPVDVTASLGTLTTSPYQSISNGQIQTIDAQALNAWVSSQEYGDIQQTYEGGVPHEIKLIGFNVTFIDASTASVSYTISDRLPSGRVLSGTSCAIVIKDQNRWQIAVHCQHPV
jgi:hypothetical protein